MLNDQSGGRAAEPSPDTSPASDVNSKHSHQESLARSCEDVNTSALAKYGPALHQLGYGIVPIYHGSKGPRVPGWQNLVGEPDISEWLTSGHTGVGVLTARTPVVDIDVYDEAVVDQLVKVIENELAADVVDDLLLRRGQAPKAALFFKTAAPFRKIVSAEYVCPDGKHHKVEILGKGQQAVAFHIHPETRQPYAWGDLFSLADVRWEELPELTERAARWIVDQFEAIAEDVGWVRVDGRASADKVNVATTPDSLRQIELPIESIDLPAAERALAQLDPASMDYDDWVRVLAAMHHQFDGAIEARDVVDGWCSQDGRYKPDDVTKRWPTLGKNGGPPTTFATMLGWLRDGTHTVSGVCVPREDIVGETPTSQILDGFEIVGDAKPIDALPSGYNCGPVPFEFGDPAALPPRRFLYGHHYARGFISVLGSPGGVGKTGLNLVEALAIATGRPLLGDRVHERTNVYVINLEDPLEEMQRRLYAALQHYSLDRTEIEGRLFLKAGRDVDVTFARQQGGGVMVDDKLVEFLAGEIRKYDIGCVFIDPWVAANVINEKDNGHVEAAVRQALKLADRGGCAIALAHHTRKTNGEDTTIDDVRGGGALIAKARFARTITRIPPTKSTALGAEAGQALFAVTDGKANMTPPVHKQVYRRIVSVHLPNGDNVGVVESHELPNAFDGIGDDERARVQQAVRAALADGRDVLRENVQAKDWVGHLIADALGFDKTDPAWKVRVKALLASWIEDGTLVRGERTVGRQGRTAPAITGAPG